MHMYSFYYAEIFAKFRELSVSNFSPTIMDKFPITVAASNTHMCASTIFGASWTLAFTCNVKQKLAEPTVRYFSISNSTYIFAVE